MALDANRAAAKMAQAMAALMPSGSATVDQLMPGCTAIAAALIDEIRDNADVRVAAGSVLQRVPDPVVALADTLGPVADVVLTGAVE